MPEAVALGRGSYEVPVFGVVDAEAMIHHGAVPPADELRYGFVIEDGMSTPVFDRIHHRHANVAAQMLESSGIVPSAQVRYEGEKHRPLVSGEHLDGLVGTFFQTHTTLPEDAELVSSLQVFRYVMDEEQHEQIMALLADGAGWSAEMSVHVYPRNFDLASSLQVALDGARPEVVWGHSAGYGDTLVFPNGYDATSCSVPAELTTHSFQTMKKSGEVPEGNPLRRTFISRVQDSSHAARLAGRVESEGKRRLLGRIRRKPVRS